MGAGKGRAKDGSRGGILGPGGREREGREQERGSALVGPGRREREGREQGSKRGPREQQQSQVALFQIRFAKEI